MPGARARAEIRQVQRAVEWAADVLEFTDAEVGGALGASARSIARWKGALHRPGDRHVEAAERLLELAHALDEVFGKNLDRLHDWLHEPLPALGRRTPLRALADGKLEQVLEVLANVNTGAFA